MKWLSNIYDPSRPDAFQHVYIEFGEDWAVAWKNHRNWLAGKVIDRPQATDEQLEEMGMVGVYSRD